MGNMSYCRFRNTLNDLRDCKRALNEGDELSADEAEAAVELLALCRKIVGQFDESDIAEMQARTEEEGCPHDTDGDVCTECRRALEDRDSKEVR